MRQYSKVCSNDRILPVIKSRPKWNGLLHSEIVIQRLKVCHSAITYAPAETEVFHSLSLEVVLNSLESYSFTKNSDTGPHLDAQKSREYAWEDETDY